MLEIPPEDVTLIMSIRKSRPQDSGATYITHHKPIVLATYPTKRRTLHINNQSTAKHRFEVVFVAMSANLDHRRLE